MGFLSRRLCPLSGCQMEPSFAVSHSEMFAKSQERLTCLPAVVLESLSHVQLFVTPWTAAHQASLFFTIFWSLFRLTSIESVMPFYHLILCRPLLLLPSIFPSIRVFSNELALCGRWPKYWSFSFSISPSNEQSGLISFGSDPDLLALQGTPCRTVAF